MAYPNGQTPTSALTPLSVGGHLLAIPARAFEEWRRQAAAAGWTLTITSAADAFRTLAIQERIFLDRYIPQATGGGLYGDIRTYRGVRYVRRHGAAAAVPGTSNHGRGLAVDIRNAGAFDVGFHAWMSKTGPALGWSNVEGRSVREPWHWVHNGTTLAGSGLDGSTGLKPAPPITPPTITLPEDDMTPDQDARLARIEAALQFPGQPYGYPAAINDRLTNVLDRLINIATDVRTVRGAQQYPGQPFDYAPATHNAVARLIGDVAALQAAVAQVAAGTGADPASIIAAAKAGAEAALKGITITVDTKGA